MRLAHAGLAGQLRNAEGLAEGLGIVVVGDVPGVGENFQDHLLVSVI